MRTPDVTPAQIAAMVAWIGAQAVAFGAIDQRTDQLILSISGTVVAAAWKIADAWIRFGRSRPRR